MVCMTVEGGNCILCSRHDVCFDSKGSTPFDEIFIKRFL